MDTYEKKYNEALERAKAYHRNELAGSRKEMTEYIFPELRESEDERMMREFNDWLCEEIECRTNDLRDEKDRRTLNMLCYILTKVKDWLEKQKERGPCGCVNVESEYDKGWRDGHKAGLKDAEMQKPVEINFEDWDTLGYIRDIVRKHVRRDEEFNVLDKWLTEHYVNQKPADKEQNSIAFLEQYGYTIVPPHAPVSIVPSSEATFTEWSEEDEKMVKFYVDDYNNNLGNMPMRDVIENRIKFKDWLLNRLKSLRPSWKPSEEQMEALRYVAYEHGNSSLSPYSIANKTLASLYEQLKKL